MERQFKDKTAIIILQIQVCYKLDISIRQNSPITRKGLITRFSTDFYCIPVAFLIVHHCEIKQYAWGGKSLNVVSFCYLQCLLQVIKNMRGSDVHVLWGVLHIHVHINEVTSSILFWGYSMEFAQKKMSSSTPV